MTDRIEYPSCGSVSCNKFARCMDELSRNSGVHEGHCCSEHGCKYGDDKCPVALKETVQEYPCPECILDTPTRTDLEAIGVNNKGELELRMTIEFVDDYGCESKHEGTVRLTLDQWRDMTTFFYRKLENLHRKQADDAMGEDSKGDIRSFYDKGC